MDLGGNVRRKYGAIAARALQRSEREGGAAVPVPLGCGDPMALAGLRPGEVVLDLGSGAGRDCLLAARQVAPGGRVYGLDMTEEMMVLAARNLKGAGAGNVELVRGEIERLPLLDGSVDVVISNCVINLSADKGRVLAEAFRVLAPGGRLAVCDIVTRGDIPAGIRAGVSLWVGCLGGALEEREYARRLERAGFGGIHIETTHRYRAREVLGFLEEKGWDIGLMIPHVDRKWASASITAVKPGP
ncbi:MAG: arsenite methyltransferase [Acidobacteria bacterium]|nr:arsenite methyltransferase [Acidobacteriota bacterium]